MLLTFSVSALLCAKNTKITELLDTRSWWMDSPTISSNTRLLNIHAKKEYNRIRNEMKIS